MKTTQQAEKMIKIIDSEIARLPATSVFGTDNAGEVAELKKWRSSLAKYVDGTAPSRDNMDPVACWIYETGFSELQDLE